MRDGFEVRRPKLLRTFKCLVDQPVHIRQGVVKRLTHSEKLQGCLEGVQAPVLITEICHIFIGQLIGFGSGLKTETGKIYK